MKKIECIVKKSMAVLLAITVCFNPFTVVKANSEEIVACECKEVNLDVMQCEEYDIQCGSTEINGKINKNDNLRSLHDGIISMLHRNVDEISNYYVGDSEVIISDNKYSSDSYNVGAESIDISDIVMVENDIVLNASEVEGNSAILYSKSGDIIIRSADTSYNGIIYAPKGTVRLEGNVFDITGMIIAKNIVVRAAEFKLNHSDVISNSVYELDFYEETMREPLSVVKNDEGMRMFWNEYECNTKTDIYVRYDNNAKFEYIESTESSEYLLTDNSFTKCDIRIVIYRLGETVKSNIVTLFYNDDGVLCEERVDSDEDLIPDGYEIWDMKTDPCNKDTDGDGVDDGYEVLVLKSNPNKQDVFGDTDGDGVSDKNEFENNTNPWLEDSDFDGICDMEDEMALEPTIGQASCINECYGTGAGLFDIVNKYVINGVEQEYVYNDITYETTYSRVGNECSIKYIDKNGMVQAIVTNIVDGEKEDKNATVYDYSAEGLLNSVSNEGVTYSFKYDEQHRMTSSYVNGVELSEYCYSEEDISSVSFGNDYSENYIYDESGNLIEVYSEDRILITYEYDENNNVIKKYDYVNDIKYEYTHVDDKLISVSVNDELIIRYSYIENGCSTIVEYGDRVVSQDVEYLENSHIVNLNSGDVYNVNILDNNVYKEDIVCNNETIISNEYRTTEESELVTSTLIDSYCDKYGNEYTYKYDDNDNLTKIYKNSVLERKFEYDAYDELTCEYDYVRGEKREYVYDDRGNIINMTQTCLDDMKVLLTHSYEYNDESWKDLCTSLDGKEVIYDEIGNPIKYGDSIMSWTDDGLLKRIETDGIYVEYTYDAEGNRLAKDINGNTTIYVLDGEQILGKNVDGEILWYTYNNSGAVIGFQYKNENYYFEKDVFNSVRKIIDTEGKVVCTYEYDAWGNILNVSGDFKLASINDFRYQSYVYDEESGFYYLQTRYYDPNNCRFLNADRIFSGSNLFVYCNNNPVNYRDPSGKAPIDSVTGSNYLYTSSLIYSGVNYKSVPSHVYGGYYVKTSSQQQVYFNCYMWALSQYTESGLYYDPGDYSTETDYVNDTVSSVLANVKNDLREKDQWYRIVYSPYSVIGTGERIIAFRTSSKVDDYHFMRKIGDVWTFKDGKYGMVIEAASWCDPTYGIWDKLSWDNKSYYWSVSKKNFYDSETKYIVLVK